MNNAPEDASIVATEADLHDMTGRIFSPDGPLAAAVPGYEKREQQQRMAVESLRALLAGEMLIVEAPTGTGKTLAYLVAAALSRKRVAVSTATKNLQEQLFYKDAPFLRSAVFPSLKFALLKGRANFVCHTRLTRFLRQPYLDGIGEPESLDRFLEWYRWTVENGQGDRSEMDDLADDDPLWPEICSTVETCVGRKCDFRDECFVLNMRARAADADLMIANHHLLLSDLAVKESGFGAVIPRYEALIADEAHQLEECATHHFGFHMTRFRFMRLVNDVAAETEYSSSSAASLGDVLQRIEETTGRLFPYLERFVGPQPRLLRRPDREIVTLREELSLALEKLVIGLRSRCAESEAFEALTVRAAAVHEELKVILADEPNEEYACWAEFRNRTLNLHASPIDVGEMMRSRLYESVSSIVFTSATLSSAGNFDYMKTRLGLTGDPAPTELILDSPFDYQTQTLLYIPKSVPEPNSPAFLDSIVPLIGEILLKTEGRCFVLFTSYRNMRETYGRLKGSVPFPMLLQGDRPKTKLLEDFRRRPGSVLFATSSFWEGVDVRGEALSCVIIDKLPFAPPDDPVVAARIEKIRNNGQSPFHEFQIPMAVIALRQGVGRLIRTASDYGVLCILDRRILTKGYGKTFLKSLSTGPMCSDTAEIERFFDRMSDFSAQVRDGNVRR